MNTATTPKLTTRAKTIAADDLAIRPSARALPNRRAIRVGHIEHTNHGELRCFARDGDVVVALFHNGKLHGRELVLRVSDAALLHGAPIPEAAFSVEIDEHVGTPWHDLNYTSIWTVHGLRANGAAERTIDHE